MAKGNRHPGRQRSLHVMQVSHSVMRLYLDLLQDQARVASRNPAPNHLGIGTGHSAFRAVAGLRDDLRDNTAVRACQVPLDLQGPMLNIIARTTDRMSFLIFKVFRMTFGVSGSRGRICGCALAPHCFLPTVNIPAQTHHCERQSRRRKQRDVLSKCNVRKSVTF